MYIYIYIVLKYHVQNNDWALPGPDVRGSAALAVCC